MDQAVDDDAVEDLKREDREDRAEVEPAGGDRQCARIVAPARLPRLDEVGGQADVAIVGIPGAQGNEVWDQMKELVRIRGYDLLPETLLADRLPCQLDDLPIPEVVRVIREVEPSRLGSTRVLPCAGTRLASCRLAPRLRRASTLVP